MNINATLLVQMINFIIAYYILDWLLFKPVMALIEAERSVQSQAQQELTTHEEQFARKESEKKAAWHSFCYEFNRSAPDSTRPLDIALAFPGISKEQLPAVKDINKEIESLASLITKKVLNVH